AVGSASPAIPGGSDRPVLPGAGNRSAVGGLSTVERVGGSRAGGAETGRSRSCPLIHRCLLLLLTFLRNKKVRSSSRSCEQWGQLDLFAGHHPSNVVE